MKLALPIRLVVFAAGLAAVLGMVWLALHWPSVSKVTDDPAATLEGEAPAAQARAMARAAIADVPQEQQVPAREFGDQGARLAVNPQDAWAQSRLVLSIGRGPFSLNRLPTSEELEAAQRFGLTYATHFRGVDGNALAVNWTPLGKHMGARLEGRAPMQIELEFPGFLPFSKTYSADEARASLERPIEIELEPAAGILLIPPTLDPLPGVDLEIRSNAAAVPWMRPVTEASMSWPMEPIAVPAGPLELWCRLSDGRQACLRLPPLATGELRSVQPIFSGPSQYSVRLAFAPGGAPVSGGKVFLLQGSKPSAYEQGDHNIYGPSHGVVLAADGQLSLPSFAPGLLRGLYTNPQTAMIASFELLFPEDHGRSVELPAPGSLVGQINGLGERAEGAAVELTAKRSSADVPTAILGGMLAKQGPRLVLDAAGDFAIETLAAGRYALALVFLNQGGPPLPLGELDIRPAEQSRFEADVAPPATGQLLVQLRIDGQPAAQRSVVLLDLDDPQQRQAADRLGALGYGGALAQPVDSTGLAHFRGVPAGRYAVFVGSALLAEVEVLADQANRVDLDAYEGRTYLQLRFAGARPAGTYRLELRRRGRSAGWTVAVDGADQAYLRDLTGAFEARIYGFAGGVAVPFELPAGDGRIVLEFGS
jgi:hypothetical protein